MPLNPTATKELLNELEHLPNKKLGQNFLVDGNIVRKSIELADIKPGDPVVEVGPGLGTLTEALKDAGATVWAIERDPTLAAHIREKAAHSANRIHLVEGDCLEWSRPVTQQTAAKRLQDCRQPALCCINSGCSHLGGCAPRHGNDTKEAGDRHVPIKGNPGAISIFLQST